MNQLSGKFEVTIANKKYKCHLSMNAFRLLCEDQDLKFSEMQKWMSKNPMLAIPKVIYFGILNHMHFNNEDASKLPSVEYMSAHMLDDVSTLEVYSDLIQKAFGGEQNPESTGKK